MRVRIRYKERPAWQFFLPRCAVFEVDGTPLFECSAWSGRIRNLKEDSLLRPSFCWGGREYRLPGGRVIAMRSGSTGGWAVDTDGRSEEIRETWPSASRRQIGTAAVRFECDAGSDQLSSDCVAATLENAIIAFHSFYQAQPGDG